MCNCVWFLNIVKSSLYHSCSQFGAYKSWGLAHAWALPNHIVTKPLLVTSHRNKLVMVTKYSTYPSYSDSINMTRRIWKIYTVNFRCNLIHCGNKIDSWVRDALLLVYFSYVTTNSCIGILNPETVKYIDWNESTSYILLENSEY